MADSGTPSLACLQSGQLKAVFFDVEGTLWDASACARHVLDVIMPSFRTYLPVDDMGEILRRFNAVLFDQIGTEHLRERRPVSRLQRFQALLDSFDVKKRGLARQMSHKYDSARRLIMREFVRDDATRVLAQIGRRGLQRGAIVNGAPAAQRHLIDTLGLQPHMDYVVLAEVEGYAKPDVRLFKRVLERTGLEAEQMMYVGDSPLTDVLGASRAGIPTVWLNPGHRRLPRGFPTPDFTINALSELLPIIEV